MYAGGSGGGGRGKDVDGGKGDAGKRGERGRSGRGTNEDGGGSAAAAGGDVNSAKAADGSIPAMTCYRCDKKNHWVAICTEKQRGRCNGREHAYDVIPTSTEEAVLKVSSEVGTRDDDDEDGPVQPSAFKAEETGGCSDVFGKMINRE